MKGRVAFPLATFFFALLAAAPACGQQDPNLERGLKPYGSYEGGNIDAISMTNGNLTIFLPFWSYPQRGSKLRMNYRLRYNNKGWEIRTQCSPVTGDCWDYWFWRGKGVELVQDQGLKLTSRNVEVHPNIWVLVKTVDTQVRVAHPS